MPNLYELQNALPVAPLKLVVLDSAAALGQQVNDPVSYTHLTLPTKA